MNVVEYIIKSIFDDSGIKAGIAGGNKLVQHGKVNYKELAAAAKEYADASERAIESADNFIRNRRDSINSTLVRKSRSNATLATEFDAQRDAEAAIYSDPKAIERTDAALRKLTGDLREGTDGFKAFQKHAADEMAKLEAASQTRMTGIRKAITSIGRVIPGMGRGLSAALASPWTLAGAAVVAWGRVVSTILAETRRKAKEAALAVAEQWKVSAQSMRESFDRVFKHISEGWDRLRQNQKNAASMGQTQDRAEQSNLALEQEREIEGMIANGASRDEVSRRRDEMSHANKMLQLDQKEIDLKRQLEEIEERRKKRAEDTRNIQEHVIPDVERTIREKAMPGKREQELADIVAAPNWSLTTRKAREAAQEELNAYLAGREAQRKAAMEGLQKAQSQIRKNESDELDDAAAEERLRIELETLEVDRKREALAEKNRKAQLDAADAEARTKKALEAEKEALREKIAIKEEEASADADAAKERIAELKEQERLIREQIAAAKEAAEAQMPTNADIRADRRRRRHGGYGGGDVGDDGIAGTYDDEKAMKRAQRIADKIRRQRSGQWNGRLSKEDQEFYKQWFDAAGNAKRAKDLARQREQLMLDAQQAAIASAKTQAQIAADVKRLKDSIELLKAK